MSIPMRTAVARRPLGPVQAAAAAVAALAALIALQLAVAGPTLARDLPDSFAEQIEGLAPSVVNITTTKTVEVSGTPDLPFQVPPGSPLEEWFREFFENQPGQGQRRSSGAGSGFIIDATGFIVTNNHVIEAADEITVVLNDNTRLSAELIGTDEKLDVAVLKVAHDAPLPAVSFGDSDTARVGDWVLAVGNPFGLGGSVSVGIVSARQRDISSGPYDDFIQTDAAINRGNSGGPLFNMDGEVIGINTAIFSPSGGSVGIGFAIPANRAKITVEQLKEFGRTRRGWLGVRIQSVDEVIAEGLGLDDPRGALISGVTPQGPAAEAGIEKGDVILEFDGRTVPSMRDLPWIVAQTQVGDRVPVQVFRQGRERTVFVRVGELEEAEQAQLANFDGDAAPDPAQPRSLAVDDLGVDLTELTASVRAEFELEDDVRGVLVSEIDPAGAAAEAGIREGDVIAEIGQEPVATTGDVSEQMDKVRDSRRGAVLFTVIRGGNQLYVGVPLDRG